MTNILPFLADWLRCRYLHGICAALLAVLIVGIGSVPSRSQEPIRVGLLLTYVGPTAIFARYEDKGARLLIEQVNKGGGINGRPIEIIGYDTEGKPDRAGVLFRRLVENDKVVAVIGPDSIFVVLGMSAIPSQVDRISVAAPGSLEYIDEKDRSHIVSAWASPGFTNALVLAHLKNQHKVNRIGILSTADTVGQKSADQVISIAKLFGIEVAANLSQPGTDRDLLPSLRKLASLSPKINGMIVYGSGPFGTIAVNQTELAGLDIPIGYIGGNIIPELIKDIGPETGKRLFLATARSTVAATLPKDDPAHSRIQKFVADYVAKYNEQPTYPSAVGYDMALAVVDALKAVGPDPQKLRSYIIGQQKNLLGVQGVAFNRSPSNGYGVDLRDHVIATIEGGRYVFKGYLTDSFKKLAIKDSALQDLMREHKILTE